MSNLKRWWTILMIIFLPNLFSCDTNKSSGGDLTDMNEYKSALVDIVQASYTGTISDSGGTTPCRFDTKTFQLTFNKANASEMTCQDPEEGAGYVDCTSASKAFLLIPGELTVDGEVPAPLTLEVHADFSNDYKNNQKIKVFCSMGVSSDMQETFGGIGELGDLQYPGDELTHFGTSIKHGGENETSDWEACGYTIE